MQTPDLYITSVNIKTSNGSLGIHNKNREWSLNVQDEDFKKLSQKVSTEAKVNGIYTFEEFFKNQQQIESEKSKPMAPKGSGSGTNLIKIRFSNGKDIILTDNKPIYISSPFQELFNLTKKKGTYTEVMAKDAGGSPKPKRPDDSDSKYDKLDRKIVPKKFNTKTKGN